MSIPAWILVPLCLAVLFIGGCRQIWVMDGKPKFWKRRTK
jgi:hypothetical protein